METIRHLFNRGDGIHVTRRCGVVISDFSLYSKAFRGKVIFLLLYNKTSMLFVLYDNIIFGLVDRSDCNRCYW